MRRINIFGTLFFVLLTIAIGYLSNGFRDWNVKEWLSSRPTTSETVSSNTLSNSIANSSIEVTTSSSEEKDNFGDNTSSLVEEEI